MDWLRILKLNLSKEPTTRFHLVLPNAVCKPDLNS